MMVMSAGDKKWQENPIDRDMDKGELRAGLCPGADK